jgi:hypothetical protein
VLASKAHSWRSPSRLLTRKLAAEIVRDQWQIWALVAAQAEAAPDKPTYFYVIQIENRHGQLWWMTSGSMLDDNIDNLATIARDMKARFNVVARHYVRVEMTSLLRDTREQAQKAGIDLSDPFLPPYGHPDLLKVLQPLDETMPDRLIVPSNVKERREQAEQARAVGATARALLEAMPAGGRPQ